LTRPGLELAGHEFVDELILAGQRSTADACYRQIGPGRKQRIRSRAIESLTGQGRVNQFRSKAPATRPRARSNGLEDPIADVEHLVRGAGRQLFGGSEARQIARRLETDVERLWEFGFQLRSVGVFAGEGSPASANAVEACRARGIDISSHRSRGAHAQELGDLQRVYCLTRAHLDALRLLRPSTSEIELELLDPNGEDVGDPIGGSLFEYQRCAEQISGCIAARVGEWA
ncbi:MAG: hypothetical protein QF410_15750, partial [Planctomycetota bacterium]|nr:hypothetical protein [Planctomycetota bacterium]